GRPQQGEMAAKSKDEVVVSLRRQNIFITSVKAKSRELKLSLSLGKGGGKVKDKDLVVFTRQFATMIDAGLPLVQCLDILAKQTENKSFAKAIDEIRQEVEGGATYADALKRHPKIFNNLYVNMIAAGEAGGILDTILNRLSKYIEKSMKLKKQIRSAMVYPGTIVSVAVVVIMVLMIWVIPIFSQMFKDFGGELPAPTQMVMDASNFMKSNVIYMIVAVVVSGFALGRYYKTENGSRVVDRLVLRLPVFGILARKIAVAKFTRTLGTLISSGVPILDGLEIVAKTAGNKIVEDALRVTRQSISEGKTLSEPLTKSQVFPPMVVQMIAVGETTGALDAMLGKIADFYDDEVDSTVGNLTSLLEPMLMVFLGVVIGFIVLAMYMPIFKMAGTIG
ncbi:MAG: type II secretion system F family protein, partial [Nitrospirae bacterium]|nr:type II secretion system F family protein [Nitrospirota bacterium]